MTTPNPQPFECAICRCRIQARAVHLLIGSSVVCMPCTATRSAHDLTGCSVDWHDGWDHARTCADRQTAALVIDMEAPA